MRKTVVSAAAMLTIGGSAVALAPAASAQGNTTTTTAVYQRQGPNTSSTKLQLVPGGATVYVICFYNGPGAESINGDNVWYWSTYAGKTGYIAGYYLNTGHDPNIGLAQTCA